MARSPGPLSGRGVVCDASRVERVTSGRNVVLGLVVTTGRVGVTTGRVALFPARVVARSVLARPFRNRVEGLAESGRSAEVDVRRRIEAVAAEVLATPETEHVVEGVFAGQLPEAIARSLVEHQVVGRVAAEALASADLGLGVGSEAVETERTERLVEQVLASPALERLLSDALDSRLTVDLTDRIVRSPAFRHVLYGVLSSPELRAALHGSVDVLCGGDCGRPSSAPAPARRYGRTEALPLVPAATTAAGFGRVGLGAVRGSRDPRARTYR